MQDAGRLGVATGRERMGEDPASEWERGGKMQTGTVGLLDAGRCARAAIGRGEAWANERSGAVRATGEGANANASARCE